LLESGVFTDFFSNYFTTHALSPCNAVFASTSCQPPCGPRHEASVPRHHQNGL